MKTPHRLAFAFRFEAQEARFKRLVSELLPEAEIIDDAMHLVVVVESWEEVEIDGTQAELVQRLAVICEGE